MSDGDHQRRGRGDDGRDEQVRQRVGNHRAEDAGVEEQHGAGDGGHAADHDAKSSPRETRAR